MSTIASHSPLNSGLVRKDHQYEMAYEGSNGHVIDDKAMTFCSISYPARWHAYTSAVGRGPSYTD